MYYDNIMVSIAKQNIFDSDFPYLCFDVSKTWKYFTSGGVWNCETKNRWLGVIVTENSFLSHFLPVIEVMNPPRNGIKVQKSVFPETSNPEMTSQSFPVTCFWSHGFVPHRMWNFKFMVHQNIGKENRYRIFFFAIILHRGDFIEHIKKLSYTLNRDFSKESF